MRRIRELVERGEVTMLKLLTKLNEAVFRTKPITAVILKANLDLLPSLIWERGVHLLEIDTEICEPVVQTTTTLESARPSGVDDAWAQRPRVSSAVLALMLVGAWQISQWLVRCWRACCGRRPATRTVATQSPVTYTALHPEVWARGVHGRHRVQPFGEAQQGAWPQ